ncbi:MAG: PriCT-2 domain-containing protein [Sterolibacteriaceae bacterium]|nr:PriCT-2 domain-containing protein [Sterolibacteriaceae bacterium]
MTTTFPAATLNDLTNLLPHLSADSPRDKWVRVLASAKAEFGDDARDLCHAWSAQSEKFREQDFAATWRSLGAGGGITFGTVVWMATQNGYKPSRRGRDAPVLTAARRAPAADEQDQTRLEQVGGIWRKTRPIDMGCPVRFYLTGRGCRVPPADADLRFHPDLRLYGFDGPAMVGRISLATNYRQTIGLHLTWLKRDGDRWKRTERRYLGCKRGGVVRLWPDECVTHGLGIAEGIETALSAAHVFTPVWAALDAGNLAGFPVLGGIETLTIFADNDASGVGERSAVACAERWLDAGRAVRVIMPEMAGDMNDLEMEAA